MSILDQIRTNASPEYLSYAASHPEEQSVGELILLYGQSYIEERNTTFLVQQNLPGWFSIGDDSGFGAILMRLDGSPSVHTLGYLSLGSYPLEPLADSFSQWYQDGCPLPDEPECKLPLCGDLWLVAAPQGGLKDLLTLKNTLKIQNSLGELKSLMMSVPSVVARGIPCVAFAKRISEQPQLVSCIAFSDPESSGPQYDATL